jgi:hypothetical protein
VLRPGHPHSPAGSSRGALPAAVTPGFPRSLPASRLRCTARAALQDKPLTLLGDGLEVVVERPNGFPAAPGRQRHPGAARCRTGVVVADIGHRRGDERQFEMPGVALRTSSGVTKPSHGTAIGRNAGGVGRQTPGAGGWVNRMGALRPSFARRRTRLSAARVPNSMPRVFAVPSGSAELEDERHAVRRTHPTRGQGERLLGCGLLRRHEPHQRYNGTVRASNGERRAATEGPARSPVGYEVQGFL